MLPLPLRLSRQIVESDTLRLLYEEIVCKYDVEGDSEDEYVAQWIDEERLLLLNAEDIHIIQLTPTSTRYAKKIDPSPPAAPSGAQVRTRITSIKR